MNYSKPLTPAFRREIEESIERQLRELDECQNTAYVSALRTGLKATMDMIHRLPDGFPIPVNRERR